MGSVLNQYLAVLFGKYNSKNLFSKFRLSLLFQINCNFLANLSTFAFSTSIGWIGIALVKYETDQSPLPSGRVQPDELGWIASLLGIGGLIGTIASGWMANCIGRKYSLLAMAIPQIVNIDIKKLCCHWQIESLILLLKISLN